MKQEGWVCAGPERGNSECGKEMLTFVHQICDYSGSPLADLPEFGIPEFFGPREEGRAIANAETAYPNCTFTETSDRHLAHCSQLRLSALIPAKKIVTR
jgi:hypothetical protein